MTKKSILILAVMLLPVLGFAQDNNAAIAPPDTSRSSSRGALHIETSPNAGVWLNAWAVGSTPFLIDLPPGWVIYSIRLPGYWSEVYLANVQQNVTISHEIPLKKYGHPANEIPDVSNINDLRVLENLYDNLAKQKIEAPPDSFCMAHFVADYPMLASAPAPLSEASAEYRNYYEIYINERQFSFNEWYTSCIGAIQQNQNIILARI
ncbi:MAG: hypothetical protein LBB36_00740, partial [Fibromonadaceae bacterium]|nr:hypothetical protein [Fibromonadaceae bacterium]